MKLFIEKHEFYQRDFGTNWVKFRPWAETYFCRTMRSLAIMEDIWKTLGFKMQKSYWASKAVRSKQAGVSQRRYDHVKQKNKNMCQQVVVKVTSDVREFFL